MFVNECGARVGEGTFTPKYGPSHYYRIQGGGEAVKNQRFAGSAPIFLCNRTNKYIINGSYSTLTQLTSVEINYIVLMDLSSILILPLHWYLLWALLIPICLTVIPPKPYRAYVSSILLFPILIKAQWFYKIDETNNNASIALMLQGVFINLFFYTFNLFFIVKYPELTDYRLGVESLEDVKKLRPCTWKKFNWCLHRSIWGSLVGTSWNWGPRSLPSNSSSQISFTNWLKSFVVKYIIYDRMLWLFLRTEFIQTRGWGVEHVDDFNLFDENAKISTLNQLVIASCAVFCIYFGIQTIYDIMMFINVLLLRRYEFGEYLPLFGSFNGNYTVSSLWGNVWHKLMYQLTVPHSKLIAGCDYRAIHLNQPPKYGTEKWRKYLMFFLVFTFTGIFHAMGTLNMPWNLGAGYNIHAPYGEYLPKWISRCFYSFAFFQFQFFLIVLEEFVQEAYKKFINVHLPKPILFIIGMTWISISEVYLLLLYLDELVKSGFDIRELVIYY